MSFYDLMIMSLGNLWRRKLRTILTILGVLIGTSSIVAMLSLALGMKQTIMEEYSSMGAVTAITVMPSEGGDSESGQMNEDTMLTDSNMELFQQMEHVEDVSPILEFGVNIQHGKYDGYANLRGVSQETLEQLELGEGELPREEGGSLQVVAGNTLLTNFGYMSGNEYYDYYTTGELPDIDIMKDIRKVEFYDYMAMEENYDATEETVDDTEEDLSEEVIYEEDVVMEDSSMMEGLITFRVNVTGIMAGEPEQYSMYSDSLMVNVDSLKGYLTKNFGKGKIPGQPKNNGKPLNEWVYNYLVVNVDDSDNVEAVQQDIQSMGFQAQSNKELLESAQKTLTIIELVLGGIGMVSFLVAAIGIANTMMMSTYERTKEIGIMKVLGCDMRDIQKLFLLEAGFIGFIGGIIGLGFTCILSAVINSIAQSYMDGMVGQISLITWWLGAVAIVFSTLMGMLAGFFPARRAMKLSPLAAIRTE